MSETWRVVKDWTKDKRFGVEVSIDDSAILKGLEQYISYLKDKYNPKDTLRVTLIPDPSSWEVDGKPSSWKGLPSKQ